LSKKLQKIQRNDKKLQKVRAFYKKIQKNDKKYTFFCRKSVPNLPLCVKSKWPHPEFFEGQMRRESTNLRQSEI